MAFGPDLFVGGKHPTSKVSVSSADLVEWFAQGRLKAEAPPSRTWTPWNALPLEDGVDGT